ncbi:hypothetical protein I8D64_09030 [Brachybacterium sp. MASK1Z-5]|uniref:Uncharacterized protein n=1 Tax=Brachybacterium halotolerans TaxID=2795215 RepID=A0ABS1BA92_9MICO|nr:hypothetical protein [Brachybacterium halotolerans]MBK0331545.1 hypothetical protein [Brachybacterium halotolerans]
MEKTKQRVDELPSRRSLGSSAALMGLSVVVFAIVSLIAASGYASDRHETLGRFLRHVAGPLGVHVANQIGWGFGAAITLQFGVLIAIIGGQIALGGGEQEADSRTALLMLAVVPPAALTPALLLVVVSAFHDGNSVATLFVAVPVYFTMMALGAFIGTFEVGTDEVLLEFAERRARRARLAEAILRRVDDQFSPLVAVLIFVALQVLVVVAMPLAVLLVHDVHAGPSLKSLAAMTGAQLLIGAASAALFIMTSSGMKPFLMPVDYVTAILGLALAAATDLFGAAIMLLLFPPVAIGSAVALVCKLVLAVMVYREAKSVRKRDPGSRSRIRCVPIVARAGTTVSRFFAKRELQSSARQVERRRRELERKAKRAESGSAQAALDD